MRHLRTMILTAFSLFVLGFFGVATASALPPASTVALDTGDACAGVSQLGNADQDCGTGGNTVGNVIGDVVNVISYIVGVAAVIMVIVSGFKYVTSGGDSNAVSSAKTALIYALIGIFIAVLAQILVHYVINTATRSVTSGSMLSTPTVLHISGLIFPR
jgi:hypothetical protein